MRTLRRVAAIAALPLAGCAGPGPLGGPAWADSLVVVLCAATLILGLVFYSKYWGGVE